MFLIFFCMSASASFSNDFCDGCHLCLIPQRIMNVLISVCQLLCAVSGKSMWLYVGVKEVWNRPLAIVYQVGDNIKDFSQTTQENVDTKAFIKRISSDVLLLPNAVYGSWE